MRLNRPVLLALATGAGTAGLATGPEGARPLGGAGGALAATHPPPCRAEGVTGASAALFCCGILVDLLLCHQRAARRVHRLAVPV